MTEYAVIDGQRVALTPWFPIRTNPVHEGSYQVSDPPACGKAVFYRYWTGEFWCSIGFDASEAARYGQMLERAPRRGTQNEQWRGLSHPPGAT